MHTRPRLTRSIPYGLLIAGSLASAAAGAALLVDKLGGMDVRLTDGTATGNDVYVGQIWAVFGAILVGAGVVGLLLAFTVGAVSALVPSAAAVEPPASDEAASDEVAEPGDAPAAVAEPGDGYDPALGYDTVATAREAVAAR